MKVNQLASQLEQDLSTNNNNDALYNLAKRLDDEVTSVYQAIDEYFDSTPITSADNAQSTGLDVNTIKQQIAEVIALAEDYDSSATDKLATLATQAQHSDFSKTIIKANHHISNYDFETAIELLSPLLE